LLKSLKRKLKKKIDEILFFYQIHIDFLFNMWYNKMWF